MKSLTEILLESIEFHKKNIVVWDNFKNRYPENKTYYEEQISLEKKRIQKIIDDFPQLKKYLNLL